MDIPIPVLRVNEQPHRAVQKCVCFFLPPKKLALRYRFKAEVIQIWDNQTQFVTSVPNLHSAKKWKSQAKVKLLNTPKTNLN